MAARPLALFPNLSLCLDAESCPRVLTWLEAAQLTFCACVCCHASSIGIRRGLRPFRNRASPVPILVRELDDGFIGQLSGCLVVSLFVQLLRLSKPEVGHTLRQSPKLLVLCILSASKNFRNNSCRPRGGPPRNKREEKGRNIASVSKAVVLDNMT